jgi:hypothetical protein
MKYRLKTGKHSRFENGNQVIYRVGDAVELTADEVASLGARVELIGAATVPPPAPPAPPAPEVVAAAADWSQLGELHWTGAVKAVREVTTVDELARAQEAEVAGKNRRAVLDAIEERLTELSE